jgi:hypothetical protein
MKGELTVYGFSIVLSKKMCHTVMLDKAYDCGSDYSLIFYSNLSILIVLYYSIIH